MPYSARKHQLQQSLTYHIYNRSNARIEIFHCDDDYRYFIKLLAGYAVKLDAAIYHWVIMPNHYHVLLEMVEPEAISGCMAGLNRSYACYHHKVYHTTGFLWQGRFKLQPVQKEQYLLTCGRYIERNPVSAHMVEEAQDYSYSSAGYYCLGKEDNLTTQSPCYIDFGPDIIQRQAGYRQFLRDFDKNQERIFSNMEMPLGNREFIRRLTIKNGRYFPKRRGRPKKAELFCNSLFGG